MLAKISRSQIHRTTNLIAGHQKEQVIINVMFPDYPQLGTHGLPRKKMLRLLLRPKRGN